MSAYDRLRGELPKIAFCHVPKTGGTTFRVILERQYPSCNKIAINSPKAELIFARCKELDKIRLDVVAGHFRFGFDPRLPRRFRYFTFVRNPIDRVISQYHHLMSLKTQVPEAQMMRDENWSLMDFVQTTDLRIQSLVRAHLYYLGGIHRLRDGRPPSVHEVLNKAVTNLVMHFDFVGCLELFDESLVLLHEQHGFDVRYQRHNVTPPTAKSTTDADTKAALAKHMEFEIELYRAGRTLLERRLATIEGLEGKVAQLRTASNQAA